MLVPPRRGQRLKARILPPFYGGNDFKVVYSTDVNNYGILSGHNIPNRVGVWFNHDLEETMVIPNTVSHTTYRV